MKRIVFLDPAKAEMADAAEYYEAQADGLGFDFLAEVKRAIEHVKEFPESGQILRSGIRRRLVRRFPFGVLYRIDEEETVLVAVMHLRRRPDYWVERLKLLTN